MSFMAERISLLFIIFSLPMKWKFQISNNLILVISTITISVQLNAQAAANILL